MQKPLIRLKHSNHRSITERPLAVQTIVLSTLLVTVLDLFTPLGVSAWIFFIIPLMIAYLGIHERYFYPLVLIIAIIIIIDSFFKTRVIALNVAIINRASGIVVFFVLAGLFKRQKNTNKELFDLNINLEKRVQERTAELEQSKNELDNLNKQLEVNVEELNDSNEELETFAYTISHDLRAPLRYIYGNAEVLSNTVRNTLDENGKHNLDLILKSSIHLSDLIEDLLMFTNIGRMEMNKEIINLNRIFKDVISYQQVTLNISRVSWQQYDLPNVYADHEMIKLVVECLISNAVKYTRGQASPKITLGTIKSEDNEDVFYVKDNGIGFDMSESNKLFNVFQKLHKQEEYQGTGLGLASVKRILQRHRGRVWTESKPNEGATFYVALPGK